MKKVEEYEEKISDEVQMECLTSMMMPENRCTLEE